MKKYHTGEVIIAVFILFVLWGGWKLSADVIYMDGYELLCNNTYVTKK